MHSSKAGTHSPRAAAGVLGFLLPGFAATASAADWYAGAVAATRFVYTDGNYNSSDHLRIKGGYRFHRAVAIEAAIHERRCRQ